MNPATAAAAQEAVPAATRPAAPAEFPPQVKATVAWLQKSFGQWYAANPPPPVDRFTRREFGFILWPDRPGPPPFVRHRGYADQFTLHNELKRGPHSVYYSTAYYRKPWEMKMADKGWLGAELIFDLDADHLQKVEEDKAKGIDTPLAEQLSMVKEQFKRLLDEFLFGDFGLGEDDVWITFSGGRGYHAHVVHEAFMQLGSRERREVVDYVTGKFPATKDGEPDLSHMFHHEVQDADHFRKAGTSRVSKASKVWFPAPDAPGWGGRLSTHLTKDLQQFVVDPPEAEAIAWLQTLEGIGPTRAREVARFWRKEAKLDRFVNGRFEGGHWRGKGELTGSQGAGKVVETLCKRYLRQYSLPMEKGETDEPVTADVKRLIRLPGSLHGKSGLRVVTLTRSQLDGFEPLRDAVAFGTEPVTIVARKDHEAALGGERVAVKAGEPTPVPMRHAVFFCARQAASIAAPAGPAR